MGLDISAYSDVTVIGLNAEYDEEDIHNYAFLNPDFPHSYPVEWQGGSYVTWSTTPGTDSHSFRAGSYSGYGLFRSTLAQMVLIGDTYDRDYEWNLIQNHSDKDFYELVDFSDCEGTMIGPVTRKLYYDFVNNREKYVKFVTETKPFPAWEADYFIERYDNFTKAFDLARNSGLVSFH
jgi:hypothetical protein